MNFIFSYTVFLCAVVGSSQYIGDYLCVKDSRYMAVDYICRSRIRDAERGRKSP